MKLLLSVAVFLWIACTSLLAEPAILPSPTSIKLLEEKAVSLPAVIQLYTSPQGKEIITRYLTATETAASYNLNVSSEHLWTASYSEKPSTDYAPLQPDAYTLRISSPGISIYANDEAGLLNAFKTLNQIRMTGKSVPACLITDNPGYGYRALMIDMVRLKEKDHVYFDLIRYAADLKFNTFILHFNDSNGCSIELKNHPELVTQNAMSQVKLKELIKLGSDLGIEVVPEIESWGHAGWITSKHPELAEPGSDSLCLSNPAIYDILEDIIRETASLFTSRLIHMGCDEAAYGKCEKCKAKIAEVGEGKFIADHINRVASIVRRVRKKPLIWSDVVARYPDALMALNRSVVCVSWDYKAPVRTEHLERISQNPDRELWVAPALVWGNVRIAPSSDNFNNISSSASTGKQYGAVGIETTIWLPQRYIPRTLGPGIAWAAEQSWCASPSDLESVMSDFGIIKFGLKPEKAAMSSTLPNLGDMSIGGSFWWKAEMLLAHTTPEAIIADLDYERQTQQIASQLRAVKSDVTRNNEVYQALLVAAKARQQMALQRKTARVVADFLIKASEVADSQPTKALKLLSAAVAQLRLMESSRKLLVSEMTSLWNLDRYEGPEMQGFGGGNSNLMWWFASPDVWGYTDSLITAIQKIEKPTSTEIRKILQK